MALACFALSSLLLTTALVLAAAQSPKPSPSPRAKPKRIVIPAYMYPTLPPWAVLLDAIRNGNLPIDASWIILNANNGVIAGLGTWDRYVWKQQAISVNSVARAVVYVNFCNKPIPFDTCGSTALQGARSSATMIQWVKDWIAMIGIENVYGVFLDDPSMTSVNKPNILTVVKAIRALKAGIKVFTNLGVSATDGNLLVAVDATV
jgi:hypothetical protein